MGFMSNKDGTEDYDVEDTKSDGFGLHIDRAASRLRSALAPRVTDEFVDGDVIRWKSAGRYQYAVVKAAGRYYFTGGGRWYGAQSVTYDDLITILNRAEVSDIAVAVAWAPMV